MKVRRLQFPLRRTVVALLSSAPFIAGQAATPLADQPIFSNTSVPGNLMLALSVEFPTVVSVGHQGRFVPGTNYMGYFDPEKCYRYRVGTEVGDDLSHFYPVRKATGRKCTEADDTWSGNFLNWLSMQAIDPFRKVLTGGNRVVDTPTTTILEKAWATDAANQGDDNNFPRIPTNDGNPLKARPSPSQTEIAEHTPLGFSSLRVAVRERGNKVRFTQDGNLNSGSITAYSPGANTPATVYEFYARVKVCDALDGIFTYESNCKAYRDGYKPEGLLQQYAKKMRFGAFSYLNDPSDNIRDGGVLRAQQKFIGPENIRPGLTAENNPAKEWNSDTGVILPNPDSADAAATNAQFGVSVTKSGVLNYVNKFGREHNSYKRRDPVSELYYGALRYLKNQGPVGAWTAGITGATNKAQLVDGFPVITTWNDPIQYACQRNFILGVGDTNTNWDRNLPGATGSSEPAKPAEILADELTLNSVTVTNRVGVMQGMGASLGTTGISSGSYLISGLAYDANTKDIRPDRADKPQTRGLQTVQTYWLDVLEFATYVNNNQYYLAAKYGGFKPPEGYNPETQTAALPEALWRTNTDLVGGQPRPDNYYTAAQPSQVESGLQRAFKDISDNMDAFTTSFATSGPRVTAAGGGASYATRYDAAGWTGELVGNVTTINASTGVPTNVLAWNFSAKLAAQLAGTGWDTARRVITFNTATGTGVRFRADSIATGQQTALNTAYRGGNDSGTYIDYLRGDRSLEQGAAAAGDEPYRKRSKLLGDIVGSKAKPVGRPSQSYSSSANPGYAAFKSAQFNRRTVVYVGSNDGMLHAVDGSVTEAAGGTELFAYVPGALYEGPTTTPATNGLQSLGNPTFAHHNFVDGPIGVFDVDLNKTLGATGSPAWRSVLVGALGKGGKGYYALDVTDVPTAAATEAELAAKVMWEFKHDKLGYTYGEPAMVKTRRHGWVLIFASGHNNSDGKGYFFIVNPKTGALIGDPIATGAGDSANPAGMAHVQGFILDRTDGTADAIYAGDLLGNLWRLDVSGTGAVPAPEKIATLTDASTPSQPLPVTSKPLIVIQPVTNKRWVVLGTGRLLAASDVGSTQSQSFYAIIDGTGLAFNTAARLPAGITFPIDKTELKELTDLTRPVTLNPATEMGWWFDLGRSTAGLGWRVLTDPASFYNEVAFTAMLPNGDACNPAGISRVYAIDLGTGRSVLQSGETTVSFIDTVPGVIGDLRYYSVSGTSRLYAGSDTGDVRKIDRMFGFPGGVRRLNWRELLLAD